MGVQLNLEIKFEVMPEYCEGYHRNGHKKCKCQKATTETTKRQAPNRLVTKSHASRRQPRFRQWQWSNIGKLVDMFGVLDGRVVAHDVE